MNQDNIQQLRDKVADIKYDTQQVLDRIDSMDAAYQEQTGREQALESKVAQLKAKLAESKAANMKLHETIAAQRGTIDVLEDEVADLKVQRDKARLDKVCAPTMPVIPKAVAIAIFREGVQYGVEAACTELDEADLLRIEESEHIGDFHVMFEREIDFADHIDTDWMRGKCGDYSEEKAIEALGNLCAAEKFECRIHGIDDHQPFEPEHRFDND
tara:strand:+ start:1055 stop:1696 length:642 start_codon:yes stop_codon:yes gene_type:complete